MVTAGVSEELLQQLCRDLRLMRRQAGGPSLRALGTRMRLGKSQVGAILNGAIRRPPPWDIVKGLVEYFREYAHEQGSMGNLSVRTGVDEFWRPRYTVLEYAFSQVHRPGHAADRAPVRTVPRQLPPAVWQLVGRAAELRALDDLVNRSAGVGVGAVISTIGGTAGIGKTALAVSWAHRVRDRFPDGQLYVDLRGFAPGESAMRPAEAVRGFLDAFRVAPRRVPADLDAQVALYRSLLADRRVLVVLDNARDTGQVLPLLPGAPGCLAVVTSRDQLSGLVAAVGAHPLILGPLTVEEARALLAGRLGSAALSAEPRAVDEIITWCARLPLALVVVAARAATYPGFPLEALAAELREAKCDLGALAGGNPAANARALGYRYHEADVLHHLGDTHYAVGDRAAARAAWRQALDILEELDRLAGCHVRAKLARM